MTYDFVQGHVPHVQRTILEILPMLSPAESISSMWYILLEELLQYLPKTDSLLQVEIIKSEQGSRAGTVKGSLHFCLSTIIMHNNRGMII